MLRFYLSKFHIGLLLLGLAFSLVLGSLLISFLWLTFVALVLFLFRRHRSAFREDQAIKKGMVFAPVNGKVTRIVEGVDHEKVGENLYQIEMIIPIWNEYGVFLPVTSEVKESYYIKASPIRFKKPKKKKEDNDSKLMPGFFLSLVDIEAKVFGIHILPNIIRIDPEFRVIPGDRGKREVNIGFIPFGSRVIFYIPSDFEILVEKDHELIAGETLMAGLPE